jgi:hypothetical protein
MPGKKVAALIIPFLLILFLSSLYRSHLIAGPSPNRGEIAPIKIRGLSDSIIGKYADRTISLALEIDRDAARLVAFTLKGRAFERVPMQPEPRPYEEGKEPQIEVILLGSTGERYTQRVDIGMICLTHDANTPPHVSGDRIQVHRDTFIVEVPEIEGFNRVEIAYYLEGSKALDHVGGLERKLLAVEQLDQEHFTSAGSSFSWNDLAFAQKGGVEDEAGGESLLDTSGAVYWPEDYSDPDIYRIYGDEAETEKRINVVIVPDGYTYSEKSLMESHASSVVDYFRSKTPYAEHDPFINYTLVYAYSTESGTDQCDCNIIVDTAMGTRFPNAGYPCENSGNRCLYYGSGCDTNSSNHITDAELRAPAQDETVVMVNTPRYGGCGGARAVYAAANSSASEIAVHELGHSLGGLADEYTSYSLCGLSASEINTSTDSRMGAWPEWILELGAPWEGAQYYERCIYRSQETCDMRALHQPFCAVCNQHFSLVFFGHWRVETTAPIESQDPESPLSVEINMPTVFSVLTRLAVGGNVTNAITWKLQEPGSPEPVVVATDTETHEQAFTQEGTHILTCEVIADTNFVKPQKNGANVDIATWDIDVTLAKPGEVSPPGSGQPLVFAADKETLNWEEASVSGSTTFNLYRGEAATLHSGNYGTCFQSGIATNTEKDSNTPEAGVCWTYLVTGVTSGGEGPMGNDSTNDPRLNNNPCQ